MLAFIDESGCPGFKITRGSDPIFGLGMVIFAGGPEARATEQAIVAVRQRTDHKTEFKFSKSSNGLRDEFFSGVINCPFTVRALIVDKALLYSQELRTNPESFYGYFVKMLMKYGALQSARIRLDGSGSREFRRSLNRYLRQQLGARIKDVRMSDSARDPLMQLADMCIGAITRAERCDRDQATRWREMLAPRITNVWPFR